VRKLFVDSSQTFFVQFCLRVLEQLLLSLVALSLYFAQFHTLGWSRLGIDSMAIALFPTAANSLARLTPLRLVLLPLA